MKLYAPSTIKGIKEKYGFRLTKSLGQNFLTDKNIIDRIIEGSGITEEDLVIEIGPGIGVITYEASLAARRVIAVEIDRNLIPILEETLAERENIQVINSDILKTDVNRIIEDERKKDPKIKGVKIIGNLPYYITTPIIMKLLEEGVKADGITAMMQKEVADRMQVGPGTKDYGALSLAVQYYAKPKIVANVPPNCFMPRPKVGSAVIRLERYEKPPVEVKNEKLMFRIIRASFNQRRKTLVNGLKNSQEIPFSKEQIEQALGMCGLSLSVRGEALTLAQFAQLANAFTEIS